MKNDVLTLRKASVHDSEDLFVWRNDRETREASLNSGLITRAEHEKWFRRTLQAANRVIYMAEGSPEGKKIGMIRFDPKSDGVAEVSINIAPQMRRKGYGKRLLIAGCRRYVPGRGLKLLIARIKSENEASKNVFIQAGFFRIIETFDRSANAEYEIFGRSVAVKKGGKGK